MRYRGNFKLDGKFRKKFANEINYSEHDENCRSKLAHEMRRIEQMEDFENAEAD